MSCSKHLPPFTFDVLCYLNRDQLERFSIVSRSLKIFIERYFRTKPYRMFWQLQIRGGSYVLLRKCAQWHPNRKDYSVEHFLGMGNSGIPEDLGFVGRSPTAGKAEVNDKVTAWSGYARPCAGQKCSVDESKHYLDLVANPTCYSLSEMRPYLGPTIRIETTFIFVAGDATYNPEHIAEMESLTYLWRDGKIWICNAQKYDGRIVAEHFQLILNSPTILQCQTLGMQNAHFSFKDYKILYTVRVIKIFYYGEDEIDLWLPYWQQFLEQPGVKPVVVFHYLRRNNINRVLDQFSKAFSSAVSPNPFKIVLAENTKPLRLIEFRKTNKTSGENLELKKRLPIEYQTEYLELYDNYTLERSSI
ncbi:hypothetical protein Ddc_11106 [Ditylenchus destructor]|nr:hypothetical protein Ddc_11106 [Ditylenchus destructor]